jgi:hypothetical protein
MHILREQRIVVPERLVDIGQHGERGLEEPIRDGSEQTALAPQRPDQVGGQDHGSGCSPGMGDRGLNWLYGFQSRRGHRLLPEGAGARLCLTRAYVHAIVHTCTRPREEIVAR